MTQKMFHVYQACISGKLEEVQQCLEDKNTNKEELLSRQFTFDEKLTLLHTAAKKGHCAIMQLLLHHGANVNSKTKLAGNYTPLHIAVYYRKIGCIKILLEHPKVDVFVKDDSEKTAYECAITFLAKNSEIAKIMKTAEIIQAAKQRSPQLLSKTLENVDKSGIMEDCFSQALLAAVSKCHPSINVVKCILSHIAKLSNCSNVDFMSCIWKCFKMETFKVEIVSQLVLCWMVAHNDMEKLCYFLGIWDYWYSSESSDDTFELLLTLCQQDILSVREYIQTIKCKDIVPIINIALACKNFPAAKLLLTHGSLSDNEKMYEVNWNNLELKSLPCKVLRDMYHRRQLTGKALEWSTITRIDLRHNNLTEVPPMIFQLPLLSNLLLSHNQLQNLSKIKQISECLNHLYLSHNKLEQLPESFSSSNIRTLKLDNNHFTDVPFCVCKMSELETLDICQNQIVFLPAELGLLSNLSIFTYDKDKIAYPQGWKEYSEKTETLIKWLRSLFLKTKPFHTMKLFVIGWQGKGKSTLVRRLRNELQYFEREITKGVEVSELSVQQKMFLFLPKGTKITFQVWDFAGQEDFHLMHMCFLSSTGLYLLVWNLMDGEAGIQKLRTWLNNISCKTQEETAVIIVGTHLDCVKDEHQDIKAYVDNMRRQITDMVENRRQDNLCVVDIVEVSSNPASIQGITELREKIYRASENIGRGKGFGVLKEPVPSSFHLMVDKIYELRSTMYGKNEAPVVSYDELRRLMQGISRTKDGRYFEKEFVEALEFLKDRGIILHFDDPSQELRDVYFVDPRWLFSLMNQVISNSETNEGLLRKDQLFSSDCKEILFTENYVTQGIRLLSRFHLVHALDDEHLLMPARFPEDKPAEILRLSNRRLLHRIYRMEHLPHGFFSRLLARLLHYLETMITESCGVESLEIGDSSLSSVFELKRSNSLQWWVCGLQLSLREMSFVVELIEKELSEIRITCFQSEPGKKMLVCIVEHVEAMISEWFHGMKDDKVSKLIPCIVCEERQFEDNHFFTLEDCLELSRRSEQFLTCPKHEEAPVALSDIAPDIFLQDVQDLVFESHHLDYDETSVINEGSFGKVYRAVLNTADSRLQTVAVKQFKGDELSSFRELRKEVNILRRINHPNLIQMIGVVCRPRCMVFELAPSGSLHSVLFDEPWDDIPRLVIVYIALEIVDALACLHHSKIIHRDLKAANVLVFSLMEDAKVHVKLADFGTANFVGLAGMRAPVVPMRIRAPEVLKFALKEDYGTEVDIYSFAMLLFGLVSRQRPFEDLPTNDIRSAVQDQKRPLWRNAQNAMSRFANLTRLMSVAWNHNPADRPSAQECGERLRQPEFQALMSKFAFPVENNVLFVQMMPSKKEIWVVHQTTMGTFLAEFSSTFICKSAKQSHLVAAPQDSCLKICGSRNDKVVFLLQKCPSQQEMFKIYTISDVSHPITVNFSLTSFVYDLAVSTKFLCVSMETACKFGCLDDVSLDDDTMELHILAQGRVSKVVASSNRFWVQRENTIEMYSIQNNTQPQEPLVRSTSLSIQEEIQQVRCFDDVLWVLTKQGFVKLNEDGEVISRMRCHDFKMLASCQFTCFVPVPISYPAECKTISAHDTIWVGLDTDEPRIWILSSDTGDRVYNFPIPSTKQLLLNDEVDPPMVISCNRLTKNNYHEDGIISSLAIDSSELVQLTASQKKQHGSRLAKATPSEGNWETIDHDKYGDVLIAWQALSRDSWTRHT